MVRPPHLPPIGDEEAKRKWKMMNRPSISRQFFGPKKRTVNQENYYMPVSNPNTYNNQHKIVIGALIIIRIITIIRDWAL